MGPRRRGDLLLLAGVICFFVGGVLVAAQAVWTRDASLDPATRALAVIGLILVSAGSSIKRRAT